MALKHILPLHHKDASAASHHEPKTMPKNGTPPGHPTRKGFLPNKWRNELVAAAAEFAGTFMFLFFAFGGTSVANTAAIYSDGKTSGQAGNSITQAPNTSVLLYISLIFGFSLMVNVWVFFRVSGGLFNPAVSLPLPHKIR
jgi:aquaporin related protein